MEDVGAQPVDHEVAEGGATGEFKQPKLRSRYLLMARAAPRPSENWLRLLTLLQTAGPTSSFAEYAPPKPPIPWKRWRAPTWRYGCGWAVEMQV